MILTPRLSRQTVTGRRRMYQPAQKPATGNAKQRRPMNQRKLQMGLPPPPPPPIPAAIFSAERKLDRESVNTAER